MKTKTYLALAVLAIMACSDDTDETPPPAVPPPHVDIDVDDPTVCAACHGAIVEEWNTSMHSAAHQDSDPIYGAMRTLRMGREGDEIASRCAQCHNPRSPEDTSTPAARVGVSCASCHSIAALNTGGGRKGAAAIEWAEGDLLRGPHDVGSESAAPHATGAAAPFAVDGSTLCLTCHSATQNPGGVDTCTTGTEYYALEEIQSCAECHMPEVAAPNGTASTRPTHRSHAFFGPHHLWRDGDEGAEFLGSAIALTPSLTGAQARLTMENRTGHSLPTGFPGRMLIVAAAAFDEAGERVWRNFESDPMAEDPSAVLNKVYVDAEGAPILPPYGVRIARDTRLAPGETRELQWDVPSSAQRVEVRVLVRLLPPPAATALGIEGELSQPRPIATANATRPAE